MQIDVSVGRACGFLLVFCVLHEPWCFWSFVFWDFCMVLRIFRAVAVLLLSEAVCFAQVSHVCPRYVIHITCGGPALRVHRAETMVDGLPRAASSDVLHGYGQLREAGRIRGGCI